MTRLLLSLAAGAGAALLFAPKSGTELREEIVNKSLGLKNQLLERGQELLGKFSGESSSEGVTSGHTTSVSRM